MKAFAPTSSRHYDHLSPVQALGIVIACALVIGGGSLMLPFG
ncbi:MAG TPA: hypothetical protein VKB52_09800 [Rhodanobacteraceae bacterium]|nr:hypothetical protein [Rhodanobacteraceae bacterium]